MVRFVSLASGSTGNCALIDDGRTRVLIDAGIGVMRIKACLAELGLCIGDLDGVLVTHEHTDHIRALDSLVNRGGVPLFINEPTLTAAEKALRTSFPDILIRTVRAEEEFYVGDMAFRAFPTSHDAAASVGYSAFCRRAKISIATDTGYLTQQIGKSLFDSDVLLIEANHDEKMLMDGPYPPRLKRRILSRKGHLSNAAAADALCKLADHNVRRVLLGHLSRTNNTPELAYDTVYNALTCAGVHVGDDYTLCTAPFDTMSRIFTIEND